MPFKMDQFITANFFVRFAVQYNKINTPTNTPRVFNVETTRKRAFPHRFNMEYTWCVIVGTDLLK